MLSRKLGPSGISVSAIGLGCMGLSEFYGEPTQESEAVYLLHRAVDLGGGGPQKLDNVLSSESIRKERI